MSSDWEWYREATKRRAATLRARTRCRDAAVKVAEWVARYNQPIPGDQCTLCRCGEGVHVEGCPWPEYQAADAAYKKATR